jgi:hypothetical protein
VHLGARLEQRRGDRGAGAEQVLAVIEDEQHVPVVQLVASTLRRLLMYRSGSRRAARMLSGSRVSSRSVSSLMSTAPSAKFAADAAAAARLTAVLPTP